MNPDPAPGQNPGPGGSFFYYDYFADGIPNKTASSTPLSPSSAPSRNQLYNNGNVSWLISWPYSKTFTTHPDPTESMAAQVPSLVLPTRTGNVTLTGAATLATVAMHLNATTTANSNLSGNTTNISVPKVPILSEKTGALVAVGTYAYWVSDEGIKAKTDISDPYLGTSLTSSTGIAVAQAHFQVAQSTPANEGLALCGGSFPVACSAADLRKSSLIAPTLASMAFADTAQTWLDFQNNPNTYSVDFTVSSYGVLADNFNGGLKKDLTAALENPIIYQNQFGDLAGYESARKVYSVDGILQSNTTMAHPVADIKNTSWSSGGTGIILDGLRWDSQVGTMGSTEEVSADNMGRLYLLGLTMPYIKGIWWYNFCDNGFTYDYSEHNFGMVRNDLTPKRSYFVMKDLTSLLKGAHFVERMEVGDPKVFLLKFKRDDGKWLIAAWSDVKDFDYQIKLGNSPQANLQFNATLLGCGTEERAFHRFGTDPVLKFSLVVRNRPVIMEGDLENVTFLNLVKHPFPESQRTKTSGTTPPATVYFSRPLSNLDPIGQLADEGLQIPPSTTSEPEDLSQFWLVHVTGEATKDDVTFSDLCFKKGLRVQSRTAPNQAWQQFVQHPLAGSWAQGDLGLVVFSVHSVDSGPTALEASVKVGPTAMADAELKPTGEWTTLYLPFTATAKADKADLNFFFGGERQTIELGSVYNFGKSVTLDSLKAALTKIPTVLRDPSAIAPNVPVK